MLIFTSSPAPSGYPPDAYGGDVFEPTRITPETPTAVPTFFTVIPNGIELVIDVNATPPEPDEHMTNAPTNLVAIAGPTAMPVPDIIGATLPDRSFIMIDCEPTNDIS